jgi:transcriptional regulator with XRE-family HTH domain
MTTAYDKLISTPEGKQAYCEEHAIEVVTERLCELLDGSGMSQSEFAKKAGLTAGRVSQLLDGHSNMQLKTIARALAVFDHVLLVSSCPLSDVHCGHVWNIHTAAEDFGDWHEQRDEKTVPSLKLSKVTKAEYGLAG